MKEQSKRVRLRLFIGASIIVFGSAWFLTGCGGGSSSDNNPPPVVPPIAVAPSDPNGVDVRENVRQYIEATYPESARARAALFQYAKVMEKALADASDKQLSIQHAEESNRANTCLWYTFGTVSEYGEAQDKLQYVILNTDERNQAYLMYDEQLGGEVFKGIPYDQRATACDIDPATLAN